MDAVQNIIDYMEENLLEALTPNKIAVHFFMSISSVNKIFRAVCDMTIMEYVRNRRLSLAGQELLVSNIRIIDLAYKYGYETPEAFAKAFARFHEYPPSIVRRTYPELTVFRPLQVKLEIQGGWEKTKSDFPGREPNLSFCYDEATKFKGGSFMEKERYEYHIHLSDMKQKEDWSVLLSLAKKLDEAGIKFKVDGKTMIFAHGLEFKLEKICLTFQWNEEQRILDFFNHSGKAESAFSGFKYFDAAFEGMKIRCMYYGECPEDDSDDSLFRNTDPVDVDGQILHVQSLEFYYENAEPDSVCYKLVEIYLKNRAQYE